MVGFRLNAACDRVEGVKAVTDGTGTPDPNPKNLVNWCL